MEQAAKATPAVQGLTARRFAARTLAAALALATGGAIAGTSAFAQTSDEINAGIQLNFTPPGARSLGLGGAFVALATDATAAVTNPAGLLNLESPEISIEVLASDFTHTYADRGHIFGEPTGEGIDTIAGIRNGEASNRRVGVSYVSAVLPRKNYTLAVFRHELANFKASFRRTGPFSGPFVDPDGNPFPEHGGPSRARPAILRMDLQIDSYGVAGAYKLADGLSVGAALAINDFSIDASTQRFTLLGGRRFQEADFSADNLRVTQVQSGNDLAPSFLAGYLWRVLRFVSRADAREDDELDYRPGLWVGGSVRIGPEFKYTAKRIPGPQAGEDNESDALAEFGATFHVPDVIAFGVVYKPSRKTTVSFEWDHVQYSKLTDELTNPFSPSVDSVRGRSDSIRVADGSEYHLGVEYVAGIKRANPIALRFGVWLDPDHRFAVRDPRTVVEKRDSAIFRPGDDELHLAAGIGLTFNEGRTLIDGAIDVSDSITTATVTTAVRFGS